MRRLLLSNARRALCGMRAQSTHANPFGITRTPDEQQALDEKMRRRQQRGLPEKQKIANVKKVVVVASAKGGVGKSTTAVNLALALPTIAKGIRVGLLDVDLFGPSLPILMNLQGERATLDEADFLVPLENYDVQCMSMGFLMKAEDAVVWRGLMVMSAVQRLLHQVAWKDIDVLVVDMPPGTGDTQLSVSQQVPIDAAVIVSTPQDVALADARRGVTMFRKVNVPVAGIIQNMAYFQCPNCSERHPIFGDNGAKRLAEELHLPLLGDVPLAMAIREGADAGRPIVVSHPHSPQAKAYQEVGHALLRFLEWPERRE